MPTLIAKLRTLITQAPRTLVTDAPTTRGPFDPTKLGKAAKWSSAGFVALTSVLTFLGIKDGMLTRILTDEPTASLWALILVGGGVVLSLFAVAVKDRTHLYVAWLILGILAMSVCSAALLKNINETAVTGWMLVLAFVVLTIALIWSWARGTTIALAAGLLVLAVSATSFGLYAAAKVSIATKAAPEDLRVRATLTGEIPTQTLEVTLAGSKQRDGIVAVVGYRAERDRDPRTGRPVASAGGRHLWESYFNVDETRTVSETYAVPVNTRNWAEVSIQTCTEEKSDAEIRPNCVPVERTSYLTGTALKPDVALGGSMKVSPDGKDLTATLTASNVDPGQQVAIRFRPRGKDARAKVATVLKATAFPDAAGTATWTARLPVQGVRWALHAVVCDVPDRTPSASKPDGSNPFEPATVPCLASGRAHILAVYRP